MMAETKGRGGKKPKYQIADIGGSDLTSEDISTERVLNFLIKGEMGSRRTKRPSAGSTGQRGCGRFFGASARPARVFAPEEASSEQPVKKSLDHLFERAGSGSGTPAKDLKLKLSDQEEVSVPSPQPQPQQPIVTEDVSQPAERDESQLSDPSARK